jgi:hypothetical protein
MAECVRGAKAVVVESVVNRRMKRRLFMMKKGSSSTLITTEEEEEVVSGGRNGSHRVLKDENWRYLCGCATFLRVMISSILPWATACFRFWVRSKSRPAWQNNDGGNYLKVGFYAFTPAVPQKFGWRGHWPSPITQTVIHHGDDGSYPPIDHQHQQHKQHQQYIVQAANVTTR